MEPRKLNRREDIADDDDDDHNVSATPVLDPDFSHRMNQVRIGGHQADQYQPTTLAPSSQRPPAIPASVSSNPAVNSRNDSDASSATTNPDFHATPSKNDHPKTDSKNNVNNKNANSDNNSIATNEAYTSGITSSIKTAPSAASALPRTRQKGRPFASGSGSGSGSGSAQAPKASRKATAAGGEMARYSSTAQGFPAYPNNPVLSAVSVPPSDQFPVKDQQVGPQHFTRLKLLGRGGIGQVFLVRLKDTDKYYAMKVLTKEDMIQRNKVKRVMTEREILATANHPFIVTMYASFQTADRLCFVMEYCAGGEFFRVLQQQPKKRLSETAVRFYAAEVILALEYLHHMGFIYRDLKPENILMRENGHIALTDFDLSKQAHPVSPRVIQAQLSLTEKIRKSLSMKRNNSSLTNLEIVDSEPVLPYQTNSFVGTEEYIAPEVVNGDGQSSAVDWWTLGILIYEMLTGTTPFKGSGTDETFNNIVNEQLKWPDDINVSNECKQLVKKLLRREADKRLGAENGASDIKRSKWFNGFEFPLIRNKTPPIKPKCKDLKNLAQFNAYSDEHDRALEPSTDGSSSDMWDSNPENPFVNFNMRRDESLQRKY